MKRILSLLMAVSLLCAMAGLCACSGKKNTASIDWFTLTADKTTVAPGDTVTVTLHAENCKNVACFDMQVAASDNAALKGYEEVDVGDLITTLTATEDGGVIFSGIVATTTNIESSDLATFSFTVSDAAAAGDTVTIKASSSQFLVGTDESGDSTEDVTDSIVIAPLTLTVG